MSPTATEATQVQSESPSDATAAAVTATVTDKATTATAAAPPTASHDRPTKAATDDSPAKASKRSRSKPPKGAVATPDGPSVAAHPRAARAVARAKGWGGVGGFLIAGYLSLPTGTLADAALRALIAGSVCYVVAWTGAVFVWRRLVMLEIKSREQQLLTGSREAGARIEPSTTSPTARTAS